MDTWQEELDCSFGDGPPLPPVGTVVVAGRRALKRRRVANGAAGLAAAAVLATSWYAVSPSSPTASDRLAGDPTPSAAPSAVEEATDDPSVDAAEAPWPRGELIRYVDGELDVRPGVIVHDHIRNPYDVEPPALSDAVDVTWRGQRQWLMIEKRPAPGGISSSSSSPSSGWAGFAEYVADQVDVDRGSGWADTFQLDDREHVVPTAGTRVSDRTDDPQLGPGFASPGATTGAALVSISGEEGDYFVVWRVSDGTLDVLTNSSGLHRRRHVRRASVRRPCPVRLGRGPAMSRASRDVEFSEFVAARQVHLRRIAYAVCGDWHRAEDLLQISLVKLYLAWPRLHLDGRQEAYARQIIVRSNIDESRRPWRRERLGLDGHDPAARPELPSEERSALFDALQDLPVMQRKVIVMRHWLGLSVEETAGELGIAAGTVKSHSSRGIDKLRTALASTDGIRQGR